MDKFRCQCCEGYFDLKPGEFDEVLTEQDVIPQEFLAVVCDDCYNQIKQFEEAFS